MGDLDVSPSAFKPPRLTAMAIERFFWIDHAEMRRTQRGLERAAIETTIAEGHFERLENDGRAQWLVRGEGTDASALPVKALETVTLR